MTRLNNFGATYSDVVSLYLSTDVADYGGQAAVDAALGRASRVFAMALSPDVWKQMRQVDCQEIVRYAATGQTTATLGLTPIVSGTVHLWIYPNAELFDPAIYQNMPSVSGWPSDWYARKPRLGIMEATGYSVATSTGAITGLTGVYAGNRIYASYDVDSDSASFAMQSIADCCIYGAAAELGAVLYTSGMQEWKLVDEYRQRWNGLLEAARNGRWVPDELRKLTYWQPVERASEEVRSVRLYRG